MSGLTNPFPDVPDRFAEVIAEHRADLSGEFRVLRAGPVTGLAGWLDTHFPRDDGWGAVGINAAPDLLRKMLEAGK